MAPKKERVIFSILAGAGVLALVLGVWRTTFNIKAPFRLKPATNINSSAEMASQMGHDTDEDGLSDYDEFYFYNTSPYIEDTDSDGLSDYSEINSGSDPNCPTNDDCTSASEETVVATDLISTPVNQTEINASQNVDTEDILKNLSIDDIRTMLKQAGMDETTLKKLDDKTLMEIYKEALEKSSM